MRFAILHCRHCAQHIWVPENRLGARGICPECGETVSIPADIPSDELVEGPPIMHEFRDREPAFAGACR